MKENLEIVRQWAHEKTQDGSEPPWAWFQYMKLIETLDAILGGMAATVTMESSPQSPSRPDVHLRLVDSTCPQDTVPPHHAERPVRMPM